MFRRQCAEDGRPVDQRDFADSCPPVPLAERSTRRALELVGMQAAFAEIARRGWTFVYTNDLAARTDGFDAVARRPDGTVIFIEVKATRRPIARSAKRYLRRTRHKGRQLSWIWCWASLAECGEKGASAYLFLDHAADLIRKRVARLLIVCRCAGPPPDPHPVETRFFAEPDLQDLGDDGDFSDLVRWLREIDAAPRQGT